MNTRREEPEFFNEFMKTHDYKPFICRKCGARFWSLVPRETDPDRPCSKYDFLYTEYPKVPRLTLDEARSRFIEFFKKRNHEYMDPYPVLARWRNDLYLTIASVVVFQPAVTEGITDPPYNPLVLVQPCIRLEDIDNVGLTFGRHLTSFEMAAHHAFNIGSREVYWVDQMLEYSFEFFTKELGISPERIVFKESWWEGGGNAGPCYEVVVDGLELATLVLMKYKVIDGNYVLGNVRVVDTGYGVERIAWFSQRTPTAFHAIYGRLVDKFKDVLGIDEPPYDVLRKIVYETSDIEIGSIDELALVLKKLGYSEYIDSIRKSIYMYTLLDHTKTLGLMLADGIVPSNSGEGYLARLVLRRALKTLYTLGFKGSELVDVILELMDKQIDYWRNSYVYAKMVDNRDYIMDVVELEARKFVDTITRGLKLVEKIIRRKKRQELDDLIQIYDSHGIPPEILAIKAEELGVKINIPPDFYSIVAKRHAAPAKLERGKEVELPREISEWADEFPETQRIFHENPYISTIDAKVLGVKKNYVILDQTIFYPKSGGQDSDTGYLILPDGVKIRIVGGYKTDKNVIVHEVEKDLEGVVEPGMNVKVVIDWERRYKLMRHHTATHIILGAVRKVLGKHVWQAGAEKTIEKARLDITHHKMPTKDEIKKIEELANKIVNERKDIKFHTLKKFDAEKKYGLRIYQGGAIVADKLRIVEIPGWDAEACFGTHLKNTGEVGGIKIINVEKIQDGVIRLEFIAGTRVAEYASKLEETIDEVARITGSQATQVIEGVKRLRENYEEAKRLVKEYRELVKNNILKTIDTKAVEICGLKTIVLKKDIDDEQLYRELVEELVDRKYAVIYDNGAILEIAIDPLLAREKNIDFTIIVHRLREKYSVKGGGKRDHVTMRYSGDVDKIINDIISSVKEMVGCEEK